MIGSRLAVMVELIDTRDGGIVWAEHFAVAIEDVHRLRDDIRAQTLAALEIRIGDLQSSLGWLERATTISPHCAQSLYARGWAESLAERSIEGQVGLTRISDS